MKGKRIILVFICMTLFLTGCTYGTEENLAGTSDADDMEENAEIAEENPDIPGEETEEAEELAPDEHVHEQNDAYKLFYGTWEVTSIVSKHRHLGGDEGYEDILGMQITYLPDKYEFGGIVSIENPNYLISIFPMNYIFLNMERQVSVETLMPDSDYFVWVQIVDKPTSSEAITGKDFGLTLYVGDEFFIKDDDTLYCFNYNCIYELKRVSYMEENAETAEENPDIPGGETEEAEELAPDEHNYEQNDAYKLFYGTWEVTSVVSENGSLGGDEGYEDILGMHITYLPDRYVFGGIVGVDNPNYLMSIVPTDSSFLNRQEQASMETLMPNSDYFVLVQIVDKPTSSEAITGKDYGFEPYVGAEFFIKDDDTLYCFNYNCIYELKRLRYMEDYDPRITLMYDGRL